MDEGSIKADITPREFFSSIELCSSLSVIEPAVVTLSKRIGGDSDTDSTYLALTPKELCKQLERRTQ